MNYYTNTSTSGTMVSNGTGWQLVGETGDRPPKPPKGLLATQAVQTMAGYVGQVFVDKTIVFETEPQDDAEVAINLANERVVGVICALFTSGQPSTSAGGADVAIPAAGPIAGGGDS